MANILNIWPASDGIVHGDVLRNDGLKFVFGGSSQQQMIRVLFINFDKARYIAALAWFDSVSRAEYDMTWCQGLDMAMEAMLAPVHDVILLDFDNDQSRATELLKAATTHHCKTPIICIASQEDPSLGGEAIKGGAADFLFEPDLDAASLERSIHFAIERTQAHQELTKLAHYDALTGIPNRSLFSDRLDRALQRSTRGDQPFAILFIDLDGFKAINDRRGHDVGDQVVIQIAKRLSDSIRGTDTVARIGGDEFTVLLEKISSITDAVASAEKIIDVVAQPMQIGAEPVLVGCSIGIAVYPEAGQDAGTLMRHADVAMYEAKGIAGSNYRFYTEKMNIQATEQNRLENNLLRAVQEDELSLYYQPRISLRTGKVVGAEALLRWEHPEKGVILPGDFLSIAQRSDLLSLIGGWAIDKLCADISLMDEKHMAPIRFSLNIGLREFRDRDFVYSVETVLAKYAVNPDRIDFELSEDEVSGSLDDIADAMRLLHAKGIHLSLDDFGRGLSSLSRLQSLPFTSLKLDPNSVANVHVDADSARMVKAIVGLAHNFGLQVVAKGVELESQKEFLAKVRCDQLQGYLFTAPLPFDEFQDYMAREGVSSRRSYLSVVDLKK